MTVVGGRLDYAGLELQFFDELGGDFLGSAGEEFGFFGFRGDVDFFDFLRWFVLDAERFAADGGDFFFLGGHDAFKGGVADFVDAGLYGEDGGERALEVLKPAGFEFALELHFIAGDFDGHDDGGVRAIQERSEEDAGLAEAVVVALETGENEIGIFFCDGGSQRFCGAERIELGEIVVQDVDGAVGALGESFLDGLLDAFRAHREDDDFPAVLFLEAEGFFEGVAVGFVHFKADVGFLDPVSGDGQRGVFCGDLFDADEDVHGFNPWTEMAASPKSAGLKTGHYNRTD